MNKKKITNSICNTIKHIAKSSDTDFTKNWNYQQILLNNNFQHFLIFLKPEILSPQGVDIVSTINFVFGQIKQWNITIGQIKLLSGNFTKNKKIIQNHYGTLYKISTGGYSQCSDFIKKKLLQLYPEIQYENVKILGGHQYLEHHKDATPKMLCELTDHLGTKKLGAGVYSVKIIHDDTQYILLNPFHPYQIEYFTQPDSFILALECSSDHSWKKLRHHFVGSINPETAEPESLRRLFYENKNTFKLNIIDIAHNCVHISPGPLEAMYQLKNFFIDRNKSLTIEKTLLGKQLLEINVPFDFLNFMEKNPEITDPQTQLMMPIFEATEDMNTNEIINFIQKIFAQEAYHVS